MRTGRHERQVPRPRLQSTRAASRPRRRIRWCISHLKSAHGRRGVDRPHLLPAVAPRAYCPRRRAGHRLMPDHAHVVLPVLPDQAHAHPHLDPRQPVVAEPVRPRPPCRRHSSTPTLRRTATTTGSCTTSAEGPTEHLDASGRAQQGHHRGDHQSLGRGKDVSFPLANDPAVGCVRHCYAAVDHLMIYLQLHATRDTSPGPDRPEARQAGDRQMPGVWRRFRCAALAGLLLLGAASSEAQPAGPTGPGAAIVRPRQPGRSTHFTGNFRVDLDQRAGTARERRSGRRGSDRVCRRARTSGRRLHPIHLRRSSQAGPHRDGRRPRGGLRAQVSAAALSRHAAPVRVRRSAISPRRATWRERDRRRGRQRFSSTRRRHPAAAARDQAGVHGDGVRTDSGSSGVESSRTSSRDFTIG